MAQDNGTPIPKTIERSTAIALYHCNIKIISRGKGKSAVAAAYRSGTKITNERDGEIHDYTRKGGVIHTEYADRAILWNAVEKIENAKNSQLARDIEISLPIKLTREQNLSLAREYVKKHFVAEGMCADICVHDKNDGNGRSLSLKDKVKEAEKIRKSVYSILRQEQREQQPRKAQDMDR